MGGSARPAPVSRAGSAGRARGRNAGALRAAPARVRARRRRSVPAPDRRTRSSERRNYCGSQRRGSRCPDAPSPVGMRGNRGAGPGSRSGSRHSPGSVAHLSEFGVSENERRAAGRAPRRNSRALAARASGTALGRRAPTQNSMLRSRSSARRTSWSAQRSGNVELRCRNAPMPSTARQLQGALAPRTAFSGSRSSLWEEVPACPGARS